MALLRKEGITLEMILESLKFNAEDEIGSLFQSNGIYLEDLFMLSEMDLLEMGLSIGQKNRILWF